MTKDFEDLPTRERHGPRSAKEDRKHPYPSQVYQTVERMIRGGVGKNWNKLYSKIVQKFPKAVSANRVVKDCIERHIELKVSVRIEHGKHHYYQPRGEYIFNEFFVHPTTGVLLKNPDYKKHHAFYAWNQPDAPKKKLEHRHTIVDGKHYHQVNDVWFALEMVEFPKYDPITYKEIAKFDNFSDPFIDFLNKTNEKNLRKAEEEETGIIPNPEHQHYGNIYEKTLKSCRSIYGASIRCAKYRQMGKREVHQMLGEQKEETQLPNIVRKK